MKLRSSGVLIVAIMVLLTQVLSACGPEQPVKPTPTSKGLETINPLFREFFSLHGGVKYLGLGISAKFEQGQVVCQFTEKVEMCYDATLPKNDQWYLAPLGTNLGITDKPKSDTSGQTGRFEYGFQIYSDFAPLYDYLGGARFTGKPISLPRWNYSQNRIEQIFENIGFYQSIDNTSDVGLLSLGMAYCEARCGVPPTKAFVPTATVYPSLVSLLDRIAGVKLFGQPLGPSYLASDGNIEQVFETIVVYVSRSDPTMLHVRPLSLLLGIKTNPPTAKKSDASQNFVFVETKNGLGYLVPTAFDQFISLLGGQEISGKPIGDGESLNGGSLYRQCFENLCLDYYQSAPESLRVRLLPLGIQYYNIMQAKNATPTPARTTATSTSLPGPTKTPLPPTSTFTPSPTVRPSQPALTKDTILIQIAEEKAQISNSESQTIYLELVYKTGMVPIPNITSKVTLTVKGTKTTYALPATNASGKASVVIQPLKDAASGLVPYELCLDTPNDPPLCASDSFLIWNMK